ncbi:hypothetical protein N7456_012065 [Penicillium angulare]|uniref:Histone chaperone domain-containing protein n=1 Tax=Penicillium angulare TaxID=116970 RepID=A0A9W9EV21_9EURO|nr:hypothetical protein N7456_012065 [Penicillium angulare]
MSRSGRQVVPEPIVVEDEEVDSFIDQDNNDNSNNSDRQLAIDEDEAIDEMNIMDDRTRRAQPQSSTRYNEPDENDLPAEAD